jgi:hypothetical protein
MSARNRGHRPFAVVRMNYFFERKIVSTHRTAGGAETIARILEAHSHTREERRSGVRFYVAPPGLMP